MERKTCQLMLLVGIAVYTGFLALQLLYFLSLVGFLLWPFLGICAQIAIGLPLLLWPGLRKDAFPYTVALCGLAAVLAVSGYLGIPESSARYLAEGSQVSIAKALHSNDEDQGARERLELAVEMEEADSDGERNEIRKEAEELAKSLSGEEKKELKKERDVLKAEQNLASFDERFDAYDTEVARQMNGLVLIGAFLAAFAAYLLSRKPGGAAGPSLPAESEGTEA